MSAVVLSFPKRPQAPHAVQFTPTERSAIAAACRAVSPSWGVDFYHDEGGDDPETEMASIGRLSGGDEFAEDIFCLSKVPGGFDLLHPYDADTIYSTLEGALQAMRSLAALR